MERIYNFYSKSTIIRGIKSRRLTRHTAEMGETRNPLKTLVGKREGGNPFGRQSHGSKDNVRMHV